MKRDHVLTTSLNLWTLNHLIVDLSFLLVLKESYLFHSLNLEACSLHLIEWDRIDIVERWIDIDQWSTHRSEDDKTICEERALIDDLFLWISSIIFIRDEIRDHFSRFFLIFDSDFYLYQSILAVSQLENEFDQQTIYSFESRSIKFVSLRSQSNSRFLQVIKLLQNRFAIRTNSIFAYLASR
jgi:hypothetical protein